MLLGMASPNDEMALGTIDLSVAGELPLALDHVVARRHVGQFIGLGAMLPQDDRVELFPRHVRDMMSSYTPK